MKNIAFLLFLFIVLRGYSQNIVPNGNFENYFLKYNILCSDSTPVGFNWYTPNNSDPNYMHSLSCSPTQSVPLNDFGYQIAHSGNAYFGLDVFEKDCGIPYREYIQVELSDSLKAGKKYSVKFYVSLCDSAQYAIDDIGALFTLVPMLDSTTIPAPLIIDTPQIINQPGNYLTSRTEWMLVSDTFIASGGEKYITIGNFKPYANTDTLFVPGGSLSTSYCLWSCYYIDDVSVELDTTNGINETALKPDEIKVYPNPSTGLFTLSYGTLQPDIYIYNSLGKLIYKKEKSAQGSEQIDISAYSKGIYFVKVMDGEKEWSKKVIVE